VVFISELMADQTSSSSTPALTKPIYVVLDVDMGIGGKIALPPTFNEKDILDVQQMYRLVPISNGLSMLFWKLVMVLPRDDGFRLLYKFAAFVAAYIAQHNEYILNIKQAIETLEKQQTNIELTMSGLQRKISPTETDELKTLKGVIAEYKNSLEEFLHIKQKFSTIYTFFLSQYTAHPSDDPTGLVVSEEKYVTAKKVLLYPDTLAAKYMAFDIKNERTYLYLLNESIVSAKSFGKTFDDYKLLCKLLLFDYPPTEKRLYEAINEPHTFERLKSWYWDITTLIYNAEEMARFISGRIDHYLRTQKSEHMKKAFTHDDIDEAPLSVADILDLAYDKPLNALLDARIELQLVLAEMRKYQSLLHYYVYYFEERELDREDLDKDDRDQNMNVKKGKKASRCNNRKFYLY
jgi:hypothetical protein